MVTVSPTYSQLNRWFCPRRGGKHVEFGVRTVSRFGVRDATRYPCGLDRPPSARPDPVSQVARSGVFLVLKFREFGLDVFLIAGLEVGKFRFVDVGPGLDV